MTRSDAQGDGRLPTVAVRRFGAPLTAGAQRPGIVDGPDLGR